MGDPKFGIPFIFTMHRSPTRRLSTEILSFVPESVEAYDVYRVGRNAATAYRRVYRQLVMTVHPEGSLHGADLSSAISSRIQREISRETPNATAWTRSMPHHTICRNGASFFRPVHNRPHRRQPKSLKTLPQCATDLPTGSSPAAGCPLLFHAGRRTAACRPHRRDASSSLPPSRFSCLPMGLKWPVSCEQSMFFPSGSAPNLIRCLVAFSSVSRSFPDASRSDVSNCLSSSPSFSSSDGEAPSPQSSEDPSTQYDGIPALPDTRKVGPLAVTGAEPPGAVSYETLAGIPWMSRGRLCSVLEEVAERGPYDVATWNKLLCRAEAISASLSVRDIGRLVVGMAKVKYYHPSLLRKFSFFARRQIQDADALACSGLLHSYSTLNCFDPKLYEVVCNRMQKREVMHACKLFPLSLALSACVREKFVHEGLFLAAGECLSELLPACKPSDQQSVALILNCLARLFNLRQQQKLARRRDSAEPIESQLAASPSETAADQEHLDLKELLGKIACSLPPLLPTMNLQSLTLVLNAFSRLRSLCAAPPEVVLLTCETLMPRASKLTALQAVTVLNALVKLRLGGETDLLEAVLGQLRERAHHLTPQGVCLTVKALSILRLKDRRLEEELERQVCLTFHHFSAAEVSSLRAACQGWAYMPPSLERLLNEDFRGESNPVETSTDSKET
ncbi:hypothetical protein TGPRC2_310200 [Toxoplasma gondii TgCatPRC2]|uniref:Uncharacterized protein n=1 Tax=Toxoplasma gondii TgCatPRC2 TaxID=1130821 RepID=A0A151HL13_TOXGO|nr:hypothetical protein TGPRC2_310200 [Toxoplasma gondii TgCatPRC2]